MKIQGVDITEEQVAAGCAAMKGKFTAADVRHGLSKAGVATEGYLVERVADRLMQRERKRGNIRAVDNRNWEALS